MRRVSLLPFHFFLCILSFPADFEHSFFLGPPTGPLACLPHASSALPHHEGGGGGEAWAGRGRKRRREGGGRAGRQRLLSSRAASFRARYRDACGGRPLSPYSLHHAANSYSASLPALLPAASPRQKCHTRHNPHHLPATMTYGATPRRQLPSMPRCALPGANNITGGGSVRAAAAQQPSRVKKNKRKPRAESRRAD